MTPNVLLALRGHQFGEEETKTNMEDSDGKKKKKVSEQIYRDLQHVEAPMMECN